MNQFDDRDGKFEARTYLYIRTHPSDNGVEPLLAGLPGWISPDIIVIKPDGTRGIEAAAGQLNHIEVTVTNAGGINAQNAFVDTFFAGPTTGWTPKLALAIGGGYLNIPGYHNAGPGRQSIMFPWMVPANFSGHGCLLARVSLIVPPDTYRDPASFDVIGDRHVAQRNIEVIQLTAEEQEATLAFTIVNPENVLMETQVFAQEVRAPDQMESLQMALGFGGFAQLGETPLGQFGIDLIEESVLRHSSNLSAWQPECVAGSPHPRFRSNKFEPSLRLSLPAGEFRRAVLYIKRNPNTRHGDIHAVNVTQVDIHGQVRGGLTVIVKH